MKQFNNSTRPDVLNKVSIPTVSDLECRLAYGPFDMFDSFICAGVPEGSSSLYMHRLFSKPF